MGRLRQAPVCRAAAVLAYLSRYTHRVAISNSRLVSQHSSAILPGPGHGSAHAEPCNLAP